MPLLLDALYLLAAAALSPWLLWRAAATGRYRRGLQAKLLGDVTVPNPDGRPVAWFHGVSVGEIHLLGPLVAGFRNRHPDWLAVVSSTTDTGLSEARARFPDLPVVAFPFDFSWAVGRALRAVNPAVVVLAESELWPNFLAAAAGRRVPVVVVNGRVSPRTFARMSRVAGAARRLLFRHVAAFGVQADEYADRLRQLGVTADKIAVTGSVKYDGAVGDAATPKAVELRRRLGLGEDCRFRVWVAGSTHAPEEAIVLDVFARLRGRFPALRLVLVPRHPDRFAEVAGLVERAGLPFVRRSQISEPLTEMPPVVLLDTVGELGAAWALADIGYTGGSLDGKRGGQSMIEPAGYGVPTVFGPHVWNFRDAARRLVEAGGAVMVRDAAGLEQELAGLLADPDRRAKMGAAARELVRAQQGATGRTLDLIYRVISSPRPSATPAPRPSVSRPPGPLPG